MSPGLIDPDKLAAVDAFVSFPRYVVLQRDQFTGNHSIVGTADSFGVACRIMSADPGKRQVYCISPR